MYGTVARIRARAGTEQQLREFQDRWWRERAPAITGARQTIIYRTDKDPNEYVLIVVFSDRKAYEANARDSEQDRWYRDLLTLLEGESEWTDGEIVSYFQA